MVEVTLLLTERFYQSEKPENRGVREQGCRSVTLPVVDGQGERALLLAIIIQCTKDMQGLIPGVHGIYRARIQREAKDWLMSDRRGAGSFIWICGELNLSASWLRNQLLALVENGGKVTTARARRMDHSGQSQHDGAPLGLYYQEQRYGGR